MALAKEVDLPPSLACLKNMDTLLRCPICFDFLSISMMSQCSHNYCSLCIRKFLSYKLQCPVCNLPMTEQDLRNNRILDDLVKSFQDARKQLSQVQFDSPPISPKTPSSAVKRKAPAPPPPQQQRGPKKDGSVLSHFFQKQPSAVSSAASEPRGEPEAAPAPRGKRARTSGLRTAALRVKQEPVEEEEVPRGSAREQAAQHASTSTGFRVKEEKTDCELSSPSTSMELTPVVKVECPVCEVPVAQQHINKHLDTCLRSEEKKDSLRSSGRRKPMAKVVYNLLSLVELRRRLRECHLPTQGTKEQLIRRHQEFLHIYNAECDAQEPRSAEVIAKEVEMNEKMRIQLDKTNKTAGLVFRKDQTEDEIEAVHSNYRKQHSSEFSRLVAQVKGRMETSKRAQQIKQETEAVGEETSREANLTEAVEQSPSHQGTEAVSEKPAPDTNPSLTEIISRSPSPSPSEVSISSSISDVFS